LPYLRARKNDIHVPLAYGYAVRLLEAHPEADEGIVLPAILLHDCGWAVVDQEAIFRDGFGEGMMEAEIRRAHEVEGVRIARETLLPLGYEGSAVEEIAAIIDGHDTRLEPLSRNDELVKDADKLWRYSPIGIAVACDWFGLTPAQYAAKGAGEFEHQLFTERARELARDEIALTRDVLRLDMFG
jgi:hypothetical protein